MLHQEGNNPASYKAVPYKIIFTDALLQKLKELHGDKLIPVIHKLHEKYLYLSNHLITFQDDISDGRLENKKLLGKRLLNYVIKLSEEGAIEESNYNCMEACQKYEQAQFVCNELLRDLNNTFKFPSELFEQSNAQQNQTNQENKGKKPAKSPMTKIRRSLEPSRIASFTFVLQE